MRRLTAVAMVGLLLVGCSDTDGDGDAELDPVAAAEQRVERAQAALTDAQGTFDEASAAFCGESVDYIQAVDRYGGLLTDDAATVGDVRVAGADLERPREQVQTSAGEVMDARAEVADTEQELAEAQVALANAQTGTTAAPTDDAGTTSTTAPLLPVATVDRVEQAEADLDAALGGVTDDTPLAAAGVSVNAAAVSVQVAWLRVLADAGCLDEAQRAEAVTSVAEYTTALQASLKAAGYFDGAVDGVYGPETVAAVEQLQTDNGLPVTGLVDRATAAALEAAVLGVGGAVATQAIAHTAALQTMLTVAGYWTGPIDGAWTDALTTALQSLQTDLGVPASGVVDAATLAAVQARLDARAAEATTSTTAAPVEPDDTTTSSEP